MRKPNSFVALVTLIILTTSYITKAQSSKANGTNANRRLNNVDFLGWDNGSGTLPGPLQIRNEIPNQPILFQTGGANERMRISDIGNVGIGNTAPANKLVVNGGTSLGFNLPAPANGLAVRGRSKFGSPTNTSNPLGHVHINGNDGVYICN